MALRLSGLQVSAICRPDKAVRRHPATDSLFHQEIAMFDLLLRRARLVDDTLTDIAIQDGKIAA
ncbi:hypothetical protein, partial [Klebsiella aerogenes]|uniref:hypothetical protein n=1 Tax=Klebsiella aerogenes TaxID=548 RepID=UPI0036C970EA